MRLEWAQVLDTVHEATKLAPAAGIALLEALADGPATHPEASCSLASAVLMQFTTSPDRQQFIGAHRDRLGSLLSTLWDVGIAYWPIARGDPSPQGWLFAAINSWPGCVVRLTLERVGAQYRAGPDTWTGLGEDDKHFLEKITTGDLHETHLAQVALANRTFQLHCADPEWTAAQLLPLLDPQSDVERAVRCWDAYLYEPGLSAQLLEDGLLDHFLAFAPHVDNCCRDAQKGFAKLAARLCFSGTTNGTDSTPPWLTRFTANSSDSTRVGSSTRPRTSCARPTPRQRQPAGTAGCTATGETASRGFLASSHGKRQARSLIGRSCSTTTSPRPLNSSWRSRPPLEGSPILGSACAQLATGSGPLVNIVNRHPDECARLVAHLLESTSTTSAQRWDIMMTNLIRRLNDRTNSDTFKPIREQLRRVGWAGWTLNDEN